MRTGDVSAFTQELNALRDLKVSVFKKTKTKEHRRPEWIKLWGQAQKRTLFTVKDRVVGGGGPGIESGARTRAHPGKLRRNLSVSMPSCKFRMAGTSA